MWIKRKLHTQWRELKSRIPCRRTQSWCNPSENQSNLHHKHISTRTEALAGTATFYKYISKNERSGADYCDFHSLDLTS